MQRPSESHEFHGDAVATSDKFLAFNGHAGGNADTINIYGLTRPR